MQESFRAFIAIDLPLEVKVYLGRLTSDLAGQVPQRSVRWVKPERMHLTLRFIGETDKSYLADLGKMLDKKAARQKAFNLYLAVFGCFPNCKRPRVLWAGLNGDLDAAAELKKEFDAGLVPFGWAEETRPFKPHLTIGRVKDSRQLASQQWPNELERLAIPVEAIHLVESELTPNGPIYTIRHSSNLQSP